MKSEPNEDGVQTTRAETPASSATIAISYRRLSCTLKAHLDCICELSGTKNADVNRMLVDDFLNVLADGDYLYGENKIAQTRV